jgi:Ca-activated chloride channel family protein
MSTAPSFAPLAQASGEAIRLSMQRLWLTGQVFPAGARMLVQHVFRSEEEKPIEVIYAFPLPRDASLRRFRIHGDGFEAHSELKETGEAVKAYEDGIRQGSLSALTRQYGDGLVNLTVGNIRPKETVAVDLEILCGVELRDNGFRFRFPFTLAPAYHSRAKAAMTEDGEGEMELPADEFGDLILPRFREDASALHQVGFDLTTVGQLVLEEIGSPSHTVRVKNTNDRSARISLAAEKDVPDRDLILDVNYRTAAPQVLAGGRQFAAIVPSTCFGARAEEPRRVVILLDRSGSMKGAPLSQARKAIEACLGALSETDLFGLVAFDTEIETFQPALVRGSRKSRDEAAQFLATIDARGTTELVKGIQAAAKVLEQGGGDIFILTDGQVSGTESILADARSARVRLHCLGIGSASQDRFLTLLSRETGGVSRFVSPSERVDLPAVDLFASIGRPVASGLKAGPNVRPEPPSAVFSGTPVLLFGETAEGADDPIQLTWNGGRLELPVTVSDTVIGKTLRLLQGARLIMDGESRYPSTDALAPLEKRRENRVAARLVELSRSYGLASREMSLVAVVTREGDREGELPETRVVPVGMVQSTPFGAYFGKVRIGSQKARVLGAPAFMATFANPDLAPPPTARSSVEFAKVPRAGRLRDVLNFTSRVPPPQSPDDILLDVASRMGSDGGMPGPDEESRAIATVVALMAFLSQGHTLDRGAFRSHVTRLVSFLESLTGLAGEHQRNIATVIERVREGAAPRGAWIALTRAPAANWHTVRNMLRI